MTHTGPYCLVTPSEPNDEAIASATGVLAPLFKRERWRWFTVSGGSYLPGEAQIAFQLRKMLDQVQEGGPQRRIYGRLMLSDIEEGFTAISVCVGLLRRSTADGG